MEIKNVHITNWESPGSEFWKRVEEKPDEPLIEAKISFRLSSKEYHALLDQASTETQ